MKTCTKCAVCKSVANFRTRVVRGRTYLRSWCVDCERAFARVNARRYREMYPERVAASAARCNRSEPSAEAKKERLEKQRQWYRTPEGKAYALAAARKYRETERGRITVRRYASQYHKRRRKFDPNFKIRTTLRSRLSRLVRKRGTSAVRLLGCTVDELRAHLEVQFQPGMSWENHGKQGWHIDHIRPLSSFDLTDPEQARAACHFTNLQPLWAADNLRKGDRWTDVSVI